VTCSVVSLVPCRARSAARPSRVLMLSPPRPFSLSLRPVSVLFSPDIPRCSSRLQPLYWPSSSADAKRALPRNPPKRRRFCCAQSLPIRALFKTVRYLLYIDLSFPLSTPALPSSYLRPPPVSPHPRYPRDRHIPSNNNLFRFFAFGRPSSLRPPRVGPDAEECLHVSPPLYT
jgi:hypothetical protein